MKVAFATLGCRVNQYESEAMIEKFIKEGYELVNFDSFSDVYVINTCAVTNAGSKKSRQMIRRARRLNKDAIIAVVGCYSQVSPEEVANIQGVNIVLGTRNKGDVLYYVNKVIDEKKQISIVNDVLKNNKLEDLQINEYQDKTRAFLKIQDGCNRFCSYCIIPFARGAVCSKKPELIIEEVKRLALNGFKEIILSGIQISSYGIDLDEEINLIDILEEINKINGIERIRIGSIDPTFFSPGAIERLKNIEKLCPHFHLSLQSGCDETLKRMNRKYTTCEYKKVVEDLRYNIKDVSITTDVIVGFPGESEEEFETSYNFLKSIKLSKMHIFKFSSRKGTKAFNMKGQVNGNIKDIRSNRLIKLNNRLENEFMNKFINRQMSVLYEQTFDGDEKLFEGYTSNYIKVVARSDENIEGDLKDTLLEKVEDDFIRGSIK